MSNADIIRGRTTALALTNQTGASRSPGDLVVIDTANSDSFVTSTTSNTTAPIGVVAEVIGISSNGRVVVSGYAPNVKTLGTTVKGDYLYHSTTAATAQNMAGANPLPGAFGYVSTAGSGTGTKAYIFPPQRGITSITVASNTFTGPITLVAQGSIGLTQTNASTLAINAVAGSGGGGGSSYVSGELDYVQITSNVSITATTEATANTVITSNAVTYDGSTTVMIEAFIPNVVKGTSWAQFWLYEKVGAAAAASVGIIGVNSVAGGVGDTFVGRRRLTPSAASIVYSIRGQVDAGTGTASAGAGGAGVFMPAFLRITKV